MRRALLLALASSALACNVNWRHPSAGEPGTDPPADVAGGGSTPSQPDEAGSEPCDGDSGACDTPVTVDPESVCTECVDAMCAGVIPGEELDVCIGSNCSEVCP